MARPGHLQAMPELLQVVPPPLRPDLAPGPKTPIGRGLGQDRLEHRLALLIQERLGASILAAVIAEPVQPFLVIAMHDHADPALAVAADRRHVTLAPTLAQQPDDLQV